MVVNCDRPLTRDLTVKSGERLKKRFQPPLRDRTSERAA